jgi:arginyl-tRNA synthetase
MKYPLIEFKEDIIKKLELSLKNLGYLCKVKLENPPEELGDFAFPCFQLAPIAKKSPNEIALDIKKNIKKCDFISKIEVKAGYVNFFIDEKELSKKTLYAIFSKKEKYGYLEKRNKKVIIEHTSANPNGPLHVGRARNPIIGDTLVRIYKASGYNVESQ